MSADQQDLERLRARVAELEAANTRSAVGSAIATAINRSGVPLREGATEQLVELLRPAVAFHADGFGGQVATGPSLMPVDAYVKHRLAQPDCVHFARSDDGTASPAVPNAKDILPGESLGLAAVRCFAASQAANQKAAAAIDPRADMSVPFGIKPRVVPPI